MNDEERKDLIEQAIQMVSEARDMVVEAVKGTENEDNFEAYGQYGFKQLLDEGNPYDAGLESLLKNE